MTVCWYALTAAVVAVGGLAAAALPAAVPGGGLAAVPVAVGTLVVAAPLARAVVVTALRARRTGPASPVAASTATRGPQ